MSKVLGIEKLQAKLKLTLIDRVTRGSVLDEIGEFTKLRIFQFTKRGLSLFKDTPTKLKPLSTGYKKYRKRFQEHAQTGEFFSPNRSNLTFTGQLLNAIAKKVLRSSSQAIIFIESTQRSPTPQIPTKSGAIRKIKQQPALTNKQVAERVSDSGRPFLGLDVTGRNRVRLMVIKAIRKSLKTSGLNK